MNETEDLSRTAEIKPDADVEKTMVLNTRTVPAASTEPEKPDNEKRISEETRDVNSKVNQTNVFSTIWNSARTLLGLNISEDDAVESKVKPEDDDKVCLDGSSEDALPELSDLDKQYKILREFATGGQGILLRGVDQTLQRKVAIKALRPEFCNDSEKRHKFVEEAWITAQLEHPAIVPIHSIHCKDGNGLAVTMKLIRGGDFMTFLTDLVNKYKKSGFNPIQESKSLRARLDIFLRICDALEYAHSRNVMHCDLKLENIMLGEYHEAYLMDWGIAHPIRSKEYDPATWTKKFQISGSVKFMSPETIRGEYCDQRADIYSMGVILFEIVTLNGAISGSTLEELVQKVRNHQLNPVKHRFGYHVDADLKAIILKATAAKAEDRYQQIKFLASDLRRYMRREEVMANPDNLPRKIFRACFIRHGVAMAIITLICLLTIVGAASYKLFDTLRAERLETLRHNVIEKQFVNSMDTAYALDAKLCEMEHNLSYCLLSLFNESQNPVVAIADSDVKVFDSLLFDEPGVETPKSYKMYRKYGFKADYEHFGLLKPDGVDKQILDKRIAAISRLMLLIQNVIMDSSMTDRLTLENRNKLLKKMKQGEMPINLIYFTSNEGIYFNYPAKKYSKSYNPFKRLWYRNRTAPGAPAAGWSTPYLDSSGKALVVTFSMRSKNLVKGRPEWVIAFDLAMSRLFDYLCLLQPEEKQSGVLEKAFLDASGAVIVTSDAELNARAGRHYMASKKGGSAGFEYPNRRLLARMKSYPKGSFEVKEKGRKVIYVYSRCEKIKGFFLKKIDLKIGMNALSKAKTVK